MSGLTFDSPAFKMVAGGDYVDAAASAATTALASGDVPWAIAGLTFVGRTAEAEGLLLSRQADLSAAESVAARFFVAVAICREGRHDKARQLFTRNFNLARGSSDMASRFFAAQGLAFYRYSQGRLPVAEMWAQAALKAAAGSAFVYGSVLALELLGHIQLCLGAVRAGFRHLGMASERAEALGQGALLQAMEVSKTLYRASYGLPGSADSTVAELKSAVEKCQFEDSYTRASLTLELARAHVLQGQLVKAKGLLEVASELVYRIDNPELEIDHNLCLANLLRMRGDAHQALSLVRAARHRASQRPDLRPRLRVIGLEAQILAELGRPTERLGLVAEFESLTRRTGGLIARRIAARATDTRHPSVRPGEDPMGDLVDDVHAPGALTLANIVESGWLGFLTSAVGVKPSERVLYFDVEPGSLTIFDNGEVMHVESGCSHLMRKLIMALSGGEASKETLAIHLWGRSYSPLRHDGLIYGLVAKTRKLCGTAGDWIEACEVGYRLRAGVRVATRSLRPTQEEPSANYAASHAASHVASHKVPVANGQPDLDVRTAAALNSRQMSIVAWLKSGEMVDARTATSRLAISDATASRDLASLVDIGLACRVGKGRSTKYAWASNATPAQGESR